MLSCGTGAAGGTGSSRADGPGGAGTPGACGAGGAREGGTGRVSLFLSKPEWLATEKHTKIIGGCGCPCVCLMVPIAHEYDADDMMFGLLWNG